MSLINSPAASQIMKAFDQFCQLHLDLTEEALQKTHVQFEKLYRSVKSKSKHGTSHEVVQSASSDGLASKKFSKLSKKNRVKNKEQNNRGKRVPTNETNSKEPNFSYVPIKRPSQVVTQLTRVDRRDDQYKPLHQSTKLDFSKDMFSDADTPGVYAQDKSVDLEKFSSISRESVSTSLDSGEEFEPVETSSHYSVSINESDSDSELEKSCSVKKRSVSKKHSSAAGNTSTLMLHLQSFQKDRANKKSSERGSNVPVDKSVVETEDARSASGSILDASGVLPRSNKKHDSRSKDLTKLGNVSKLLQMKQVKRVENEFLSQKIGTMPTGTAKPSSLREKQEQLAVYDVDLTTDDDLPSDDNSSTVTQDSLNESVYLQLYSRLPDTFILFKPKSSSRTMKCRPSLKSIVSKLRRVHPSDRVTMIHHSTPFRSQQAVIGRTLFMQYVRRMRQLSKKRKMKAVKLSRKGGPAKRAKQSPSDTSSSKSSKSDANKKDMNKRKNSKVKRIPAQVARGQTTLKFNQNESATVPQMVSESPQRITKTKIKNQASAKNQQDSGSSNKKRRVTPLKVDTAVTNSPANAAFEIEQKQKLVGVCQPSVQKADSSPGNVPTTSTPGRNLFSALSRIEQSDHESDDGQIWRGVRNQRSSSLRSLFRPNHIGGVWQSIVHEN